MNRRILLVDDELHLLKALERQLEDLYDLTLALGPFEGLDAVNRSAPYPVIVADMRMPGMDGVQFLSKVCDLSPTSVRMMLTGNADQQTAVHAVNEGNVFRFLNKPAEPESLIKAINACLAQHDLIQAEKELLEQTLGGSIRVLVEILSTANPSSFGRAQGLKAHASKLATALNAPDVWHVELAAMLCQVGSVALPPSLGHKGQTSERLPEYEASLMSRIPLIGSSLLKKIPRLDSVAEAVLYQDQCFDGTGVPGDGRSGADLPLGSRILKVVKDFSAMRDKGRPAEVAINLMRTKEGWYDPDVLSLAAELLGGSAAAPKGVRVKLEQLMVGDTLGSDLLTRDGILLAGAGREVTELALARIGTYVELGHLEKKQTVYVFEREAQAA